jgi:hypothetical protein
MFARLSSLTRHERVRVLLWTMMAIFAVEVLVFALS